ncbi:hypothetical protein BDL97_18G082700 [Sphagnum fallax]|nr:hypothetical protein BDL97_18G082700 [Sphagnum fallax]
MISIIMSCIWVFISHTLLQGGTELSTLRIAAAAPVDPDIRSSSLEVVLLGSTRHLLLQHSSSKTPAPHPRGASSSSLGFGGVLTEGILELDGSLSEAQLLQIKTAVEENDDDDEDNSDEGDISTASSSAAAASPGDDVMIQEEVGFAPCPAYLRDAIPAHHNNNSDDTSENMKETSSSCVILVPPLYVREFRWPLSQSQAWLQNVVNSPLLHSKQANSWVEVQSSTILFHSGGPMYPFGAGKYLEHLEQLVPGLALGEKTRVVLDFGCGTGSLSVAMEQRGVTTLCIALSQSEEDGIQLVLERGYPGILTNSFSDSILVRLPYPNQAFGLLHCAACNISSWLNHHDGMLLLEADRILHSGGFFVWTVDVSLQLQSLKEMERQLGRLCWKVVGRAGTVTVWQKPSNITDVECHLRRDIPVCLTTRHGSGSTVWKVPLQNCIDDDTEGMTTTTVLEENMDWKIRLLNPPRRLWQTVPALGITAAIKEVYLADFNYWVYITDFYVHHFGPRRILEIRNVLDMNAMYGG